MIFKTREQLANFDRFYFCCPECGSTVAPASIELLEDRSYEWKWFCSNVECTKMRLEHTDGISFLPPKKPDERVKEEINEIEKDWSDMIRNSNLPWTRVFNERRLLPKVFIMQHWYDGVTDTSDSFNVVIKNYILPKRYVLDAWSRTVSINILQNPSHLIVGYQFLDIELILQLWRDMCVVHKERLLSLGNLDVLTVEQLPIFLVENSSWRIRRHAKWILEGKTFHTLRTLRPDSVFDNIYQRRDLRAWGPSSVGGRVQER